MTIISISLTLLLTADSAISKSSPHTPRRGDGVREYQRLIADLRKAVTNSRKSVEALAAAPFKSAAAATAKFDKSLHRLEVDSIHARARVEVLEKRGEAYFEEWAEELAGTRDEAARQAAKARFAELHEHFETVLKESRQLRQEFRQFLDGLRGLRSALGREPTSTIMLNLQPKITEATANGHQTEAAIAQLMKTLKAAEKAVMSGPAPLPKTGDTK